MRFFRAPLIAKLLFPSGIWNGKDTDAIYLTFDVLQSTRQPTESYGALLAPVNDTRLLPYIDSHLILIIHLP